MSSIYVSPRTLRVLRKSAGLTLRQASLLTGIPIPTISAAEHGRRRLNKHRLESLLSAYGFTLDDIEWKEME